MSRNSSGTYSLPAGQPVVTGTTISAATFNTLTSDLASELTDSLSRSNKGAMLAQLQLYSAATKTAPAFAFDNDSDTGFYRAGANNPAISAGDTKVQDWTTTGTTITGTATVTGTSTLNSGGTALLSDGSTLSGFAALWSGAGAASPTTSNYVFAANGAGNTTVNSATTLNLNIAANAVGVVTSAGIAVTGTLGCSGNFAVATNKFTVAAASGNTAVAGTLGVTGTTSLTGSLTVGSGVAVDTLVCRIEGGTGTGKGLAIIEHGSTVANINIGVKAATPTTLTDGDMWIENVAGTWHFKIRMNGATSTIV